jgi:hypothetical protein
MVGILLSVFVPIQRARWGVNDFLPYWSASKVMLSGGNPYDPNELFQVQIKIEPEFNDVGDVNLAWGPPWTMLLISPLIFFGFEIATRLWIFCNVMLLTVALYLLWGMLFERFDKKGLILTLGIGFLFGYTIRLIELGQFSGLLLLGYIICIWCLDREYYTWAGMSLFLMILKPQITYLVLAVIFLWAVRNRKWKIFLGFFLAYLGVIGVLWWIYPNWLSDYYKIVVSIPNVTFYSTTLGSFFESIYGIRELKYIGLMLILLSFPLSKYVEKADWLTSLNLALLISIPLAPYGFSYDHVLLLPSIVQIASWIWNKDIPPNSVRVIGIGIVTCYILIYIIMNRSGLPYYWSIWPTIGLIFTYFFAWWKTGKNLKPANMYL